MFLIFLLDIPSSSDDFTDLDDYNDIDDEYEKISNPLSYHLKQHFRMRRRQISQRSISVNERTSHHHQSDDEKVSPRLPSLLNITTYLVQIYNLVIILLDIKGNY